MYTEIINIIKAIDKILMQTICFMNTLQIKEADIVVQLCEYSTNDGLADFEDYRLKKFIF